MKKLILLIALFIAITATAQKPSQHKNGVYFGEMTSTERDAVLNRVGYRTFIFNSTTNQFEYWDGVSAWVAFGGGGGGSHFTPSTLLTDYSFTDNSTDWNAVFTEWGAESKGNYLRKDIAGQKSGGDLTFNNGIAIRLGTGGDESRLVSNGATTLLDLYNGDFEIRDNTTVKFTFGRTTGDFTATGNGIFGGDLTVNAPIRAEDDVAILLRLDRSTNAILDTQNYIDFRMQHSGGTMVNAGRYGVGAEGTWGTTGGLRQGYIFFSTIENGNPVEAMRLSSIGDMTVRGKGIFGGDLTAGNFAYTNSDSNLELGGSGTSDGATLSSSGTKFLEYNDFNGSVIADGLNLEAQSFVKQGGTADQFLKADGSVDAFTTALERIDEGNGLGTVIFGRNAADFGNVGSEAVDFSSSSGASTTRGATGGGSMAFGSDVIASDFVSMSMGHKIDNDGIGSLNAGINLKDDGYTNFLTGIGHDVTSMNVTVVGQASEIISEQISDFNATSDKQLFVVGNGTIQNADTNYTVLTRSNAFEVLFNGSVIAPSITNALINTAGDKSLISKEYADDNYIVSTDLDTKENIALSGTTGTIINLSNTIGNYMNQNTPNATATYTHTGAVVGGKATIDYDSTGDTAFPTITLATNIDGSVFEAGVSYQIKVENYGGTIGVLYYFDRTDNLIGGGGSTVEQFITLGGRFDLNTTNSWMTSRDQYGGNYDNDDSIGTAATPAFAGANIGMGILPEGATITRVIVGTHFNNNEVDGIEIYIAGVGHANGIMESYDAGSMTTEIILGTTALNIAAFAGDMRFSEHTINYTLLKDRAIKFALRPVGTLTATRYSGTRVTLYYTLP